MRLGQCAEVVDMRTGLGHTRTGGREYQPAILDTFRSDVRQQRLIDARALAKPDPEHCNHLRSSEKRVRPS